MTTKQKRWTAEEIEAIRNSSPISQADSEELSRRAPERIWRLLREGGHVDEYGEWISKTWSKPEGWDDE